jgi:hypothetical protein
MTACQTHPHPRSQWRGIILFPLLTLLAVGSGCKTQRMAEPVVGAGYQPENVYHSFGQLPVSIRRVAMLPMTSATAASELAYGRQVLEGVLLEELGKTKKFELVAVTPEQLRVWTGQPAWSAEETLPAHLLKMLKEELGCEAVLFSRLTQYRAYPPLAVGFSLKLADVDTAEFVWAVDEIFDASEPDVVNGARRYQLTREQLPPSLADSRSILNSPSGFGRYAARSVFRTLPDR